MVKILITISAYFFMVIAMWWGLEEFVTLVTLHCFGGPVEIFIMFSEMRFTSKCIATWLLFAIVNYVLVHFLMVVPAGPDCKVLSTLPTSVTIDSCDLTAYVCYKHGVKKEISPHHWHLYGCLAWWCRCLCSLGIEFKCFPHNSQTRTDSLIFF